VALRFGAWHGKWGGLMNQSANFELWLVVHMPKTAGTSFRWALEKYFGASNVIRDYGPHSQVTDEVVRKHLYGGDESKGPESLVAEISIEKKKVLIGHFPLQKYADYFDARNIITFVRDPLVRLCSEYLHRAKNETFTGTFSEFLEKPGYQNLQSRFLKGAPDDTFIGITEQYAETLKCINRAVHWNLAIRKKNVGRRGGGREFAGNLSVHDLDLFYKMNTEDVELYRLATRRFADLCIYRPTQVSYSDSQEKNHQA
jgi:hypothetical protein